MQQVAYCREHLAGRPEHALMNLIRGVSYVGGGGELRGFIPRANYIDRATAATQRS
jgi:hypothetical protein